MLYFSSTKYLSQSGWRSSFFIFNPTSSLASLTAHVNISSRYDWWPAITPNLLGQNLRFLLLLWSNTSPLSFMIYIVTSLCYLLLLCNCSLSIISLVSFPSLSTTLNNSILITYTTLIVYHSFNIFYIVFNHRDYT